MPPLQARLNKILKVKLDGHNWLKYLANPKEWGQIEGSKVLSIAKIKTYLNAPIMASFGNLKEEATKF